MRRVWLLLPALVLGSCGPSAEHVHHHAPAATLDHLLETPDFELVNSAGQTVRSSDLEGKVWLANFIFTRCTGPCPLMTQRMKGVQDALRDHGWVTADSPVRLVSISVDPAYDTPEVLARFAETWKADTVNWDFLTGPPETVMDLIRNGFKITAQHEGSGTDAIVHSTSFLLVDQQGSVRRIARLEDPDLVGTVLGDIHQLVDGHTHQH